MAVKKTVKKRAAKKVASSQGSVVPLEPWPIEKIVKFMQENPDIGVGLHNFFEGRRDELLSNAWAQVSENYDQKAAAAAFYLTDEVLSLGFKK